VRFDTRERRTRRAFAFLSLILWIVLLSDLAALTMFAPRFFASLAAFVYCFLPFVIAAIDKLRRRAANRRNRKTIFVRRAPTDDA
jgi:hypothetical protein